MPSSSRPTRRARGCLVEAAIAGGNRPRFVLLSSLAARQPQISDYAASKLAGEAELTRLDGELPWSILRPPAVYGPGDRETLAFFRALRMGIGHACRRCATRACRCCMSATSRRRSPPLLEAPSQPYPGRRSWTTATAAMDGTR